MVRSYLDLTIKFHDYSSFFAAFDVATYTNVCLNYEPLALTQTYLLLSYLILSYFMVVDGHNPVTSRLLGFLRFVC